MDDLQRQICRRVYTETIMVSEIYRMFSERASICQNPIFIIGSPRSGTSILALSLAQHSNLWTSGESYFIFDLFGANRLLSAYKRAYNDPSDNLLKKEDVSFQEFAALIGLGINTIFI